jgi:hypothetical protein
MSQRPGVGIPLEPLEAKETCVVYTVIDTLDVP